MMRYVRIYQNSHYFLRCSIRPKKPEAQTILLPSCNRHREEKAGRFVGEAHVGTASRHILICHAIMSKDGGSSLWFFPLGFETTDRVDSPRRFKSCTRCHFWTHSSAVEHPAHNGLVFGSNPFVSTKFFNGWMFERLKKLVC